MFFNRREFVLGLGSLAAVAAFRPAFAQGAGEPFTHEPLPYPADANEPHIDATTMEIHHGRHHATYVNNLNGIAGELGELAERPLPDLLADLDAVPEAIRTMVRNNAGGHANHTMFWRIMGGEGGEPGGDVAAAIERDFGSFDALKEEFNTAGTRVFGSGWVFVTVAEDGRLALTSRPNQDTPLMDGERVLIGNDVWEHAYYLQYQNRRADYLEAWWNVVNWNAVADRYAAAQAGELGV